MAQKAKKKSKLRHAEYYDMQKTFDSLYADSKSGEVFGHLMDIISAPNNIKLAFRNIKGNDGSHTAGTDGRTIESLAVMSEDKFVKLIQKQFRRYEPKAVKRVEIPKPNGKMRPLGIPCIIDRIVQQCILQVMEPICEAKFYEHSYGFRPCRSAENAISYAYGLAQRNKLHYVVDVDVKGFFDNVDHRKLLKQIWTLGIRDTKLIQIIKAMLKAPIEMPDGENVLPSKGTPQGGILSPLLANIVLNELDWWIASQWDEMVRHMKHAEMLRDMVKEVNATQVAPAERLTNDVYHFDTKDHVFEKADRFTERQKEKEAQVAKTEKVGKEQPDQKPKTKKHDMEL